MFTDLIASLPLDKNIFEIKVKIKLYVYLKRMMMIFLKK